MLDSRNNKYRILFICHDASLTGAPILLYNLLQLLKERNLYEIEVLLKRGGELEDKFRSLYPTHVLRDAKYDQTKNKRSKLLSYLAYALNKRIFFRRYQRPDFVFNNTIANGRLLKDIKKWNVPIITYVHELESVIREFNRNLDSDMTFRYADLLVAPSRAVTQNLIKNHSARNTAILKYYFPFRFDDCNRSNKSELRKKIAEKYNCNVNALWIVGMGTVTRRKGADIFVNICQRLSDFRESILFFWIGDFSDPGLKAELDLRITELNLQNIIFTGPLPYNVSTLMPFDLFLLTSREDPYPLVVVEAAYNKVPAVCFESSGGIPEFLEDDAGWIVADQSEEQMSEKLKEISGHAEEIIGKGERAYNKALEWHANGDEIIKEFNKILISQKKADGNKVN